MVFFVYSSTHYNQRLGPERSSQETNYVIHGQILRKNYFPHLLHTHRIYKHYLGIITTFHDFKSHSFLLEFELLYGIISM